MRKFDMRTVKVIAGFACLVVALVLPGFLALGIATNFGFGRASAEMVSWDWCLASLFALCAIGLVASGLFLIVRWHSLLSKRAKVLIAIGVFIGIIPAVGMVSYLRATSMTAEEACRHNVQMIDAALKQWQATNGWSVNTNASSQKQ